MTCLPWLSNYIAGRDHGRTRDYAFEIDNMAILARGINRLIDDRQIKGDKECEKLCRFVYRRMTRIGDWMRLVGDSPGSTLGLLKRVQRRNKPLCTSDLCVSGAVIIVVCLCRHRLMCWRRRSIRYGQVYATERQKETILAYRLPFRQSIRARVRFQTAHPLGNLRAPFHEACQQKPCA